MELYSTKLLMLVAPEYPKVSVNSSSSPSGPCISLRSNIYRWFDSSIVPRCACSRLLVTDDDLREAIQKYALAGLAMEVIPLLDYLAVRSKTSPAELISTSSRRSASHVVAS